MNTRILSIAGSGAAVLGVVAVMQLADQSHDSASARLNAAPTAERTTPAPPPIDDGPQPEVENNWQHALFAGTDISASDVANEKVGFQPAVPAFDAQPTNVQVAISQFPALGWAYTLTSKDIAADDKRVIVVEAASNMKSADLQQLAATSNSSHSSGQFLQVDGYDAALLSGQIQGKTVGRIMVLAKGFTLDITGPSCSPDEVLALAKQVL